jgi:hypothetical protein
MGILGIVLSDKALSEYLGMTQFLSHLNCTKWLNIFTLRS